MPERRMLLKSTAKDLPSFQSFLKHLQITGGVDVSLITTASVPEPDKRLIEGAEKAIEELGFARTVQRIDMLMYGEDDLLEDLRQSHVIFMGGGNTYFLQRAINRTGFSRVIAELMDKHGAVYIGASAGSAVAGTSVGMSTSDNAVGLKYVKGMSLVPFAVASHYSTDKNDDFKARSKKLWEPVVAISDSQAILVEGQDHFLVGGSEPVVFNANATTFPPSIGEPQVTRFKLNR